MSIEENRKKSRNKYVSELTPKQQRFVQEYLKDFNGTKAAARAGYSARTSNEIAVMLCKNPKIKAAIEAYQEEIRRKSEIDIERIERELAIIAFADMADYVEIGADGQVTIKPFDDPSMPAGASRAVARVKEVRRILGSGEGGKDMVLEIRTEYSHHDKLKALELLGKQRGMFREKIDVDGDVKLSIVREVVKRADD